MKNFAIARRYAKALLLIGKEDGQAETYKQELDGFARLMAGEKELERAITNPLYTSVERKKVLQTGTLPLLMEKVPALPLFTSVFIWGYRTNVKNFKGWPSNFFYLKDIEKPYGKNDVYKE